MDRDATWALCQQGREAWNAWADEMLARRQASRDAGTWDRDAEKAWSAEAAADFRDRAFDGEADFIDFSFPGDAGFDSATFSGTARFHGATFSGYAGFGGTTFSGTAWFDHACFSGAAGFGRVTFSGDAWFDGATFSGNAWFAGADLRRIAIFDNCRFERAAGFQGSRGGIAFSLAHARFDVLPDFVQAHFAEAPRLDNVRIEPRDFWPLTLAQVKAPLRSSETWAGRRRSFVLLAGLCGRHWRDWRGPTAPPGGADRAARWRALKRLAIQGHDHGHELAYFAAEFKAGRGATDMPWHWRFWFGLVYQALSDFGRSLWRPVFWWLLATFTCFGLYLNAYMTEAGQRMSGFAWAWHWLTGEAPRLACRVGDGSSAAAAANLALRKGLLFVGLDADEKLNQIYACLYGVHNPSVRTPRALPANYSPITPDAVHTLGLVQTLVSAVLIFLFLLAVRNHFRIR